MCIYRAGSVIVDADVTFDQVGANGLSVLFTAVRNETVGTFKVNSNALVVVITGLFIYVYTGCD